MEHRSRLALDQSSDGNGHPALQITRHGKQRSGDTSARLHSGTCRHGTSSKPGADRGALLKLQAQRADLGRLPSATATCWRDAYWVNDSLRAWRHRSASSTLASWSHSQEPSNDDRSLM